MRVISRKIYLDELVSRIPGSIPSIKDAWTVPSVYVSCEGKTEANVHYSYSSAVREAAEYGMNPSKVSYTPMFVGMDNKDAAAYDNGNYGLIPSDVIIPTYLSHLVSDYTDYNVNIPDGNGGFYDLCNPKDKYDPHYEGRKIYRNGAEIKVLTYRTLLKWFLFFKEYYSVIDNGTYVFESALDYYNKVVHDGSESTKAKYAEMDDVFNSRGGESVYSWITSNCILQYEIPSKYRDYWNVRYLYYYEVLKWTQWFADMESLYSNVKSCENVDDCEDCVEYRKRGGSEIFDSMKGWLAKSKPNSNATYSASVTVPINLQTSIDDLGEMSILSERWKAGKSYKNYFGDYLGTVVERPYVTSDDGDAEYLNDTYIIKKGIGYGYNSSFLDCEFEPSMWTSYTDQYITDNHELFKVAVTSYTYSPITDEVVYNPTDDSPQLRRTAVYNNGKIVVINGKIYHVIKGKYVTYCYYNSPYVTLHDKKIPVVEVEGTDVKYAYVNGVAHYVSRDGKIYFSKVGTCHVDESDSGCDVEDGEYIIFQDAMHICEDGHVVISENHSNDVDGEYEVLDGYFVLDGSYYYVKDGKIVDLESVSSESGKSVHSWHSTEGFMSTMGWKTFSAEDKTVTIVYDYEVHDADKITGVCESKLELFRRNEITSDKMGNVLPGYFNIMMDFEKEASGENSKINEPYDGCWLDLLYYVGYATNMSLNVDLSDTENGKFYSDGDILNDMDFYSLDESGLKKCEFIFSNSKENCLTFYDDEGNEIVVSRDKCKGLKYSDYNADFKKWLSDNEIEELPLRDFMDYTRLIKMQSLVSQWYTSNKAYTDMETHCDFTYYIGAIIEQVMENGALVMYKLSEDYNKGIKYTESALVRPDTFIYHCTEDNVFTVNYYNLLSSIETMRSDYNMSDVDIAPAVFEFSPMLYGVNKAMPNGEIMSASDLFDEAYWARHNGFIVEPLFRRDFDLAFSTPPKIESDIYIDRGISAAFDKHIKLQEIKTLDALLQYGNGSFQISEN